VYPVLIDLFGISISSFGAMLAIAVVLGTWVGANLFEEQGLTRDLAWTLAIWALIGGLIGGKLWFIGERWMRGTLDLDALSLGAGGLTWYGGAVVGFSSVAVALHVYRVPFWKMINIATIPGLLAQAIGRIGCFLVGDDYGRPSDLPWAVAFPKGAPPTLERVHPTMLYEAAWLVLCIALLYPRRLKSPAFFAEYMVVIGVGRFFNEFLRNNPPLLGPLSQAQLISLLLIAAGAGLWIRASRRTQVATAQPAPAAASQNPGRRRA
jgi:phosphatidylglycerol:prolipoprotein diacylglycerol transferase